MSFSLTELLGDLLNGAVSIPVSITTASTASTVVGGDCFFGERSDEEYGGGGVAGVQSVTITVPMRHVPFDASCPLHSM